MFPPPLGWNVHYGTFQQFEQTLLNSFTRHITGNRGVIAFSGNLVNLVNKHNAPFGSLYIVVGSLQKAGKYAFDILANVTSLSQDSSINDGKGNMKHAGNGTGKKSLTGTCFSHKQDIGFFDFHLIVSGGLHQALVVVVHGHRKEFLGLILPHHVLIKKSLDLGRCHQFNAIKVETALLLELLSQNAMSLFDTAVTYMTCNPCNQKVSLLPAPSTKRTFIHQNAFIFFFHAQELHQSFRTPWLPLQSSSNHGLHPFQSS